MISNHILASLHNTSLKKYLEKNAFEWSLDGMSLGSTGYMEGLYHYKLPHNICYGSYNGKQYLAIRVYFISIPHVIVLFERYIGNALIVTNGLPTSTMAGGYNEEIITELLLGFGKYETYEYRHRRKVGYNHKYSDIEVIVF